MMVCTFSSPLKIFQISIETLTYSLRGQRKCSISQGVCALRATHPCLSGESWGFGGKTGQQEIRSLEMNAGAREPSPFHDQAEQTEHAGCSGNRADSSITMQDDLRSGLAVTAAYSGQPPPQPNYPKTWPLSGPPIASQGHIRGGFPQSFVAL